MAYQELDLHHLLPRPDHRLAEAIFYIRAEEHRLRQRDKDDTDAETATSKQLRRRLKDM